MEFFNLSDGKCKFIFESYIYVKKKKLAWIVFFRHAWKGPNAPGPTIPGTEYSVFHWDSIFREQIFWDRVFRLPQYNTLYSVVANLSVRILFNYFLIIITYLATIILEGIYQNISSKKETFLNLIN